MPEYPIPNTLAITLTVAQAPALALARSVGGENKKRLNMPYWYLLLLWVCTSIHAQPAALPQEMATLG